MTSLDPDAEGDRRGSRAENPAPPARRRGAAPRRSFIHRHQYLTVALATLAILAGLGVGLHIANFYGTVASKGSGLVKQFHHQAQKAKVAPASCQALGDSVSGPQALVEAPAIGLSAPVEAGVDDDVLNVAVGHVPGSAWPSQPGTTLLAAHDVSYFSGIDQLADGTQVRFTTPCDTYVYKVTGHQVVAAGSPIYSNPAQSLLILETCYPLNALFITSQRFLVTASLVRVVVTRSPVPSTVEPPPSPTVPAPAPLAAQGLTLDNNEVQLGVLQFSGRPSRSWKEGPDPLADEAAALADYFGGLRSAEQDQPAWWSALAPGVPFTDAQPLVGASPRFLGSLTPTLAADGSTFTGATIQLSMEAGGDDYALTVTEVVVGNTLEITGWSMQRG
jgi:sortase A